MYNIDMSDYEYSQRVAINESRGYFTEADFYGTRDGRMLTKLQYENNERRKLANSIVNGPNPIWKDLGRAGFRFFRDANGNYNQWELDQRHKAFHR